MTYGRDDWASANVTASTMIAQVVGCAQGQMSQWGCGRFLGTFCRPAQSEPWAVRFASRELGSYSMSRKRLSYNKHVVEATSLRCGLLGSLFTSSSKITPTRSMWISLNLSQANVSRLMKKR